MNFIRKLFRKKDPPPEMMKFIAFHVCLNRSALISKRMTYSIHVEEDIIKSVKERYGLDDATARIYYQETFKRLKQSGQLK